MEHYTALSPYLKRRFGCKVYKLSLSAGCTCPNRDGTLGARGCIFCSGSGEFAASCTAPIPEQLEQAKYILGKGAGGEIHRLFSGLYKHLRRSFPARAAFSCRDGARRCGRALDCHEARLPAGGYPADAVPASRKKAGLRGARASDRPSSVRTLYPPRLSPIGL